jgi:hypothetical protein
MQAVAAVAFVIPALLAVAAQAVAVTVVGG